MTSWGDRSRSGNSIAVVGLAVGYFLTAMASILVSRYGDNVAGVWFAGVFAFAMLARNMPAPGPAAYAAIALASLAANLVFGTDLVLALLFSAANVVYVVMPLELIRRFVADLPLRALGVRSFVLVLALTGIASAAVGFGFSLVAFALLQRPILETGWRWMSGGFLGYSMFLPLALFATRREIAALADIRKLARLLTVSVLCMALSCMALHFSFFPFVLVTVPLMVAAPRVSTFELALACALTGAACLAAAIFGTVPGMGEGAEALTGDFQVALAVTVATPFVVGLFLRQMMEDRSRIAEAETRWNFALASAGQGVWDANLREGTTSYSATWKGILGYEDHEINNDPGLWLKLAHPDDVERVKQADRDHMEGRRPDYYAEYRMRHRDGRWIWIADHGKAVERDERGRAVRAIGSITDITGRKASEMRLARSAAMLADEKERLRVTLQSIGDAVICTDATNHITFMNPVAEKLTGMAGESALGQPLDQVYRAADEETGQRLAVSYSRPDRRGGVEQNSRAVLLRGDGSRCSIRQMASPILNEGGEFCGLVIVFQDFTDARALQRQLAHAAAHDALTGLANRSSFIRTMEDRMRKARNGEGEHQFMFIDLDNFKPVNDTSGHAAGDALLKRVAAVIRGALGPQDVVARLGGDEFAVVMKAGPAAAEAAAKALVEVLRRLDFNWEGRRHSIGASIGVASIHPDHGEVDEIIALADAACYAAKNAGRGCVVMASMQAGARPAAAATLGRSSSACG